MNSASSYRVDVLVAGAGAAGVAAAIAAARNGANTLLVDSNGYLGGISAMLSWLGFHDSRYRQVVKGQCAEFIDRLQRQGDASRYVFDPKCSSAVSLNTHAWKVLAMELCQDAGVKLMLQTLIVDTLRTGDRIHGVVVEDNPDARRSNFRCDRLHRRWRCSRARRRRLGKGRTKDGMVQAPTLYFVLAASIARVSSPPAKIKSLAIASGCFPIPISGTR